MHIHMHCICTYIFECRLTVCLSVYRGDGGQELGPCYSEQVASCRRLMLELEAGGSSGKGRRVCGGDRNDQKPLQELVPQEGGSCPTASALGGKRVLHEPLSPGPGAGGAQAQGRGPAVRVAAAHPAGGPHCGHCPPPTPWGAQEDPLWGRASEVPLSLVELTQSSAGLPVPWTEGQALPRVAAPCPSLS